MARAKKSVERVLEPKALELDRWLSVKEVAERLSLSVAFVYDLTAKGLIRSARFGNAVRIKESSVAEYVSRCEQQAAQPQ